MPNDLLKMIRDLYEKNNKKKTDIFISISGEAEILARKKYTYFHPSNV